MKAAQLRGPKDIRLAEVPGPGIPESGEALVEILSVGICGSDLHMYETGAIGGLKIDRPLILGHEFCARIVDTRGEAINELGQHINAGMRVAVEPHVACGHCEQCLEGNPNLCPNHLFYGVYPTHGALCERMTVATKNCFPIPDDINNAGGALLETLGVAIHSVDLGKIKFGDTVAVIGCGPVGVLIARLALLAGASKVLAFDLLESLGSRQDVAQLLLLQFSDAVGLGEAARRRQQSQQAGQQHGTDQRSRSGEHTVHSGRLTEDIGMVEVAGTVYQKESARMDGFS